MKNTYIKVMIPAAFLGAMLLSCESAENEFAKKSQYSRDTVTVNFHDNKFEYLSEEFADLQVLRYHVKDFDSLDLRTKTQLYYLYEAALAGRDIIYDQNYKYNLAVRKTLEAIVANHTKAADDEQYDKLLVYAKRVWFSNGIHHHYGQEKIFPGCSREYFMKQMEVVANNELPLRNGQTKQDFIDFIVPVIFDSTIAPKKVNLDPGKDLVQSSAVNFYENVTEKEATEFYRAQIDKNNKQQPSYGLNSKLVKENGKIVEKVWKAGGMYGPAIEKIVFWLEKAASVAENDKQKAALDALIKYYRTGDLKDFDAYNLAWIKDTESNVDVVNGFIENYADPLQKKGTFESVVSVRDRDASKRIQAIGSQAQWFEDNSPIMPEHKKKDVVGISAKVINVVIESGDAAPSSAIGINLPNSEWIREIGSKSVQLGNIVEAKEQASGGSVVNEFFYNDEIRKRVKEFAAYADVLHTDMHEVIGHASGKIEDGAGQPHEKLKNYYSPLEEGRADLVALYYLMDPKLVELGVMPSLEYGKAAYDDYITTGLVVQLSRIPLGKDIEEAHMRNRKFISEWVLEKGAKENVISRISEKGKTYFVVNDHAKLRTLFGQLLREIQRIKSQGDYNAGRALVDNYGVKIDPQLHAEVRSRYEKLKIAPYSGFIQPKLVPVHDGSELIDVKIEYPDNFTKQMMEYGRNYALLPAYN
jgi:dipeptidyl-peptidase III